MATVAAAASTARTSASTSAGPVAVTCGTVLETGVTFTTSLGAAGMSALGCRTMGPGSAYHMGDTEDVATVPAAGWVMMVMVPVTLEDDELEEDEDESEDADDDALLLVPVPNGSGTPNGDDDDREEEAEEETVVMALPPKTSYGLKYACATCGASSTSASRSPGSSARGGDGAARMERGCIRTEWAC